jgi:hypothetical protein
MNRPTCDFGRRSPVPSAYPLRMRSQRSVIDYSLARRAMLADLFAGRASTVDVCDAHPYLLRAAKYHGEPTETSCPVCRKERLTHVTYVYGDELREFSGRIRATAELAAMDCQHTEFTVYVVEVCRGCSWNHLTTSYVLGSARERPRRARRRAAEE